MQLIRTRALVTGASSGIGRATALALAAEGCDLTLTGRDEHRLRDVARATGGEMLIADLRHGAEVHELARLLGQGAPPDIVVHSAGVGHVAPALELTDEDVERLLTVNFMAPMRLTRALAPVMTRRGSGRLVFVTSIAGVLGVARESAYAASKAALGSFAASMRAELAPSGVGVTTVVPGAVDTEFFDRRGAPYARRYPRPVPVRRVASAVVRALEADRDTVVVPGWLRAPIALQACAPQTFARFAARWG